MTRHLIVSTCGTSLLTNGAPRELRNWLVEHTNRRENDLSSDEQDRIRAQLSQKAIELDTQNLINIRRLSAELNGVVGFYGGQLPANSADQQILLHTDTFQGHVVADTLREWLAKRGLHAVCQPAAGLTTRTIQDFNAGISSVITWCEQNLPGYQESQFRIVFNLVGGFKSL